MKHERITCSNSFIGVYWTNDKPIIMKKILAVLAVATIFSFGFSLGNKNGKSLIPEHKMMQVGVVVEDIEIAASNWAELLGLEETPKIVMAAESEKVPTEYLGGPTNGSAKLAFFRLDNITIELIQPVGENSTWYDFLVQNGEGIHHIAFNVKGMESHIQRFEENGIPMVQRGGWATGEYSYLDGSESLGLIIELLENYN